MSESIQNQNASPQNAERIIELDHQNIEPIEIQDTQEIHPEESAPTNEERNADESSNQNKDQNQEKTGNDERKEEKKNKIEQSETNENNDLNIASTSEKNSNPEISEDTFCAKISNHSSNISIMCRICYDDTLDEPIISPCKCKGTIGMMHKSCLEKWLAESNTNRCDLCFHRFETERTTKFSVGQSFYRWLKYPPSSFAFPIRDMRSDMITCLILIPFSFLLVYLCLFAAEYYNRQTFTVIPVARWTAISVMFMGIVIVLGFCTWIYLVFRYHSRVWYFWWQRETIVRILFKNGVIESVDDAQNIVN